MVWGDFNRDMINNPELGKRYAFHAIPFGDRFLNLHVRRDLRPPPRIDRPPR
jgi:hypothetical protein